MSSLFRKLSIILLVPALIVMGSFFYMASGATISPVFLTRMYIVGGIFVVLLAATLMRAKAPNGPPPRIHYNRYEPPQPEHQPEPETEEVKFYEVRGTHWTKNFVSEPDQDGNAFAMFVRRTDNDTRVAEETEPNKFVIYRLTEDHEWERIMELSLEMFKRYIEDWSKGLA